MKHRIPGGLASLGMAMLFAAFSLWWTHPWIYSRGFGEVDSMDIAAGIRQGQLGGLGLREPLLYLPQAQQLYYALFFHWPWSNTWSIEAITYWMNRLSWAASGLSVGLLFLLLRRLACTRWACFGVVAVYTSPALFELATFGHPATLSVAGLLMGVLLLVDCGSRVSLSRPAMAGMMLLSALSLGIAVGVRADVAMVFPLMVALVRLTSRAKRRTTVITCGIVVLILMGQVVAGSAVVQGKASAAGIERFLQLTRDFIRPSAVGKGMVKFVLYAGLGSTMALAVVGVGMVRRRQGRIMLSVLALSLPVLVYTLCNPYPGRRFAYAILTAGVLLALAGRKKAEVTTRSVLLLVLCVATLNLGFVPALRFAVRASGIELRGGAVQRLSTDVFERHRRNQEYLDWDRSLWEGLTPRISESCLLLGGWISEVRMRYALSGRDLRITRAVVDIDQGSCMKEYRIDGQRFFFWEVYPGVPTRLTPEGFSCARLLLQYEDALRGRFPEADFLTPPEDLQQFRPY